jgi:hypothetical protein
MKTFGKKQILAILAILFAFYSCKKDDNILNIKSPRTENLFHR